jgi:hypothetical protein
MPKQNQLIKLVALVLLGTQMGPGHAALPAFRKLSAEEIKAARALQHVNCNWSIPPWIKPGLPLPSGVALESEGYVCITSGDSFVYDFVQARSPTGMEILFACKKNPSPLPFFKWITNPKSCGVAVIAPPTARAAQVETARTLGLDDRDSSLEVRESPEGQEYYVKLRSYFEPVLRRCSKHAPTAVAGYVWLGRISTKGKVARSGMDVTTVGGNRSLERSAYAVCIVEGMKQLDLPVPPMGTGSYYLSGGWPIATMWKHDRTGDKIKD